MSRFAIALSLLLALNGCARLRVGKRFDAGRLGDLEPLLSERADVRRALGAPLRGQKLGDLTVEVHQYVTANQFQCVLVSYRGDTLVSVTQVR